MDLVDIDRFCGMQYIVDEFQSDGTFKAAYAERLKMRREKFMTDLTKLL
jgi:hypothetical protein